MTAPLEGILFLCGDEGISKDDLKEILELKETDLNNLIETLMYEYENNSRGIKLEVFGDLCKLVTKKEHANVYAKLVELDTNRPLTQAALEVLAIIAYNQPITRSRIDEIRGIGSSHIVRKLVVKDLIIEASRSEQPGRPILYKTTSKFLDSLGLKCLNDLPVIDENTSEENETDLFSSKYTESL